MGETVTTSSESLFAQFEAETDPEQKHILGVLWQEARRFEADEMLSAMGTVVESTPWVEVDGIKLTGWFEAPGVYKQKHHVHMKLRDIAWCGRAIPAAWSKLRPVPNKVTPSYCAYCKRRQSRWATWGE